MNWIVCPLTRVVRRVLISLFARAAITKVILSEMLKSMSHINWKELARSYYRQVRLVSYTVLHACTRRQNFDRHKSYPCYAV